MLNAFPKHGTCFSEALSDAKVEQLIVEAVRSLGNVQVLKESISTTGNLGIVRSLVYRVYRNPSVPQVTLEQYGV